MSIRNKHDKTTYETRLKLILELSKKISSTLDIDSLLELIMQTTRKFIHYDSAGIYILDPARPGQIRAHKVKGYDSETYSRFKIGVGIVGWVVKTGFATIVPDVHKDKRYVAVRASTRSELVVPIRINGKVIGAFNLESDQVNAYTKSDLDLLLFFASYVAISIEKVLLHEALMEKKRLEAELAVARRVQQSLLPKSTPQFGRFDIAGINHPIEEVGGDYFDYLQFSEEKMGIVVADVAGKGVPAALIMASFRAMLRAQLCDDCPPAKAFCKLNMLLGESNVDDRYVTAFYMELRKDSYLLRYINAGHNPPVLIRSDNSWLRLDSSDTVLGLLPAVQYREILHEVSAGDMIIIYTDGLTDTLSEDEETNVSKVVEVAIKNRHLPAKNLVDEIYSATSKFKTCDTIEDDCTLVVVKIS
ncbi:MAG: SpoIIE family protein phosphatase [Acidobacteriota bacterium]|nr:SpoIIE family protein phosphatase [Blastocatellia bacterium]MDW8413134.1 SpoIIE family protein phosphatase [Acidobacteriota bacterium]